MLVPMLLVFPWMTPSGLLHRVVPWGSVKHVVCAGLCAAVSNDSNNIKIILMQTTSGQRAPVRAAAININGERGRSQSC